MSEEEQFNILAEAAYIIAGDRGQSYGAAHESFERIAVLWSPVLGIRVTPDQVALCMIQLKIARFLHGQQRDSVVDIAGYAGLLGRLHGW